MTVLEALQQAEQNLIARVRELEPLVREHAALVAELERRGLSATETAGNATDEKPAQKTRRKRTATGTRRRRAAAAPVAAVPAPSDTPTTHDRPKAAAKTKKPRAAQAAKATPRAKAKRPGGSRAPRGGRAAQIQNLVAQTPGVTVKDLGTQLGVDATGLYHPVRKLVADGALRKDGAKLHPVSSDA
ncbi:hypothetical protein DSM112329_02926 [Paraconexibacter sp. AEG42_29]|uniref:MarR family transcriptional regulator n=1 Tax=Paraconexibacter sp. AEG42_29 TaxID=2997339 RepID=A0AAU7AWI6_9ACTN